MNYQNTIKYLYSQLPMFQHNGKTAYKEGLDNALALDKALGHPHQTFNSIHIAGTNGKGSVSNFLASILQHAGYNVGLYTSPHLKDFRERIRLNGKMIPKKDVCAFVEKIKPLINKLNPSFFELTTSMAFNYFAEKKVDIAIIEVGLGGRLDSTNIIKPVLSVITNISFDHMQFLGNTLTAIATEKAGIIKANTAVVIGESKPETKAVFSNKAKEMHAPIFFSEELIQVTAKKQGLKQQVFDSNYLKNITVGLGGWYQQKNIATVLTAIIQLQNEGIKVNTEAIYAGFKTVRKTTGLQGRWQVLQKEPTILCDTGHNQDAIEYILNQLETYRFEKLRLVIGMVNDKDIDKILSLLPKNAQYYFCKAQIPRALNEQELLLKAKKYGLTGNSYPTVAMAIIEAKKDATPKDLIFIGGSTFVVAEAI